MEREQTQFDRAIEILRSDPRYEQMARSAGITPAHTPEMYEAEVQRRWGAVCTEQHEEQKAA